MFYVSLPNEIKLLLLNIFFFCLDTYAFQIYNFSQVVLSLSDHSTVYLTNITLETSGLFQCEVFQKPKNYAISIITYPIKLTFFYSKVSTEAPKFKTVAADAVMNVVQPPTSTPRYTVFVLIEV